MNRTRRQIVGATVTLRYNDGSTETQDAPYADIRKWVVSPTVLFIANIANIMFVTSCAIGLAIGLISGRWKEFLLISAIVFVADALTVTYKMIMEISTRRAIRRMDAEIKR